MSGKGESFRFQSLEFNHTPWTRWVWSFAIHGGAGLLLIAIPVSVQHVIPASNRFATVSLVVPPRPVPVKTVSRPLVIPPPYIKPVASVTFVAPPSKPLPPKTIILPAPPVDIPKPPEIVRLETPKIDLPARPVIRQEVFPANDIAPASPEAPIKTIKTGGFGDPNGVASGSASSGKGLTVHPTGSFDAPGGQGKGGGGARAAVASAGFGEYDARAIKPATGAARLATPVETPVEITFKPKPLYTPDAREKKIEGEVQLEVLFSSTGEIRVLRLVRGLGSGLDESARTAASQIRFRPGTRNGSPVDTTGTVHIVFELS
jgi:TonB family protein